MLKISFKMLDLIVTGRVIGLLVAFCCILHLTGFVVFRPAELLLLFLILILGFYITSIRDYEKLREIGRMRLSDRVVLLETALQEIKDAQKDIAESVEPIKLKE